MKKLNKYLASSLSLSLVGIGTSITIISCANEKSQNSENNNLNTNSADPATGSLVKNIGESLTHEQKEFQEASYNKVKTEMDKVYDPSTKKLKLVADDESNKGTLITEGIAKYKDNIKNNIFLSKFVTSVGNDATKIPSSAKVLFDEFKQKNLLPSVENLDNTKVTAFFQNSGGIATRYGLTAKTTITGVEKNELILVVNGILAAFYLDPLNISMLSLYYHIAFSHDSAEVEGSAEPKLIQNFDAVYLALVNLFNSIATLISSGDEDTAVSSPAYQAWSYYLPIAKYIKDSIYE